MNRRHVFALFFLSCLPLHSRAQSMPPDVVLPLTAEEMDPAHAEEYLAEHPETLIFDVRTEGERMTRGCIPNSVHHDYFHGQKTLETLAQLDKTKPCMVYCAMGGRAKLMAVEMDKLGFKHILLLKGGFNAWVAEGRAVAK